MIIKKPFLIITIALFFLNGCGFKVLEPSNVYISKFDVSGDKILADKIKNGVKTFFSDVSGDCFLILRVFTPGIDLPKVVRHKKVILSLRDL